MELTGHSGLIGKFGKWLESRPQMKGQIDLGGFPLLMIVVIMLIIAAVCAILIGQLLAGVLNNLVVDGQAFNQPSPYLPSSISPFQAYMTFFSLEYNADIYIPFWFIMINIGIIIAGTILNSSLKGYAVGFFAMLIWLFMAFLFSNSAHLILEQNIFASAVIHLPQSIVLIANLGLYEWIFMIIYLLCIAGRAIFFKEEAGGGGFNSQPAPTFR